MHMLGGNMMLVPGQGLVPSGAAPQYQGGFAPNIAVAPPMQQFPQQMPQMGYQQNPAMAPQLAYQQPAAPYQPPMPAAPQYTPVDQTGRLAQQVPYAHGPGGISMLASARSDGTHQSSGFDTTGGWPTRVVDLGEQGNMFNRVSPFNGMAMTPAGNGFQYQPHVPGQFIPGVVPSSEQTLAQMDMFNKQAAHNPTYAPTQQQPVHALSGALDAMRNGAQHQQQWTPPQSLGQAVPGTFTEMSEGNTVTVTDRRGNQMFFQVDEVLLDDGEGGVTCTMVNPDPQFDEFLRMVPIDTAITAAFDGKAVTNLALPGGQTRLNLKTTKMAINNRAIGKKYAILAVDQ